MKKNKKRRSLDILILAPYWDTPAKWKLNLLILILIRVENLEKKWEEKAALKKILRVRSSVFNYKQNSISE